ncbi:hypothetical protein EX30DRAFT_242602 [Ascodesmis nigricans]|uniref:Uncharacterized protein n=1 Tax=Ascodesmis nigricans TaxID=341454 RepID=A0A4S2MI94_9PEZI|nr:hypothetical protein EX30DRAFT_242602 [Ascodesmis nigricans]
MKPQLLLFLHLLGVAISQELDATSPQTNSEDLGLGTTAPAVVEGPPNHAVVEMDRTIGTPGRTQDGEVPGKGVGVDITVPILGVDAPSVDESEAPVVGEGEGGESSTAAAASSSAAPVASSLPPSPPSSFLPILSSAISSSITSIPSSNSNSSSPPSSSAPSSTSSSSPSFPSPSQPTLSTAPITPTTTTRPILLPTFASGDGGPQSEQTISLGGDDENSAPRLSMGVSVTVLVVVIVAGLGMGV